VYIWIYYLIFIFIAVKTFFFTWPIGSMVLPYMVYHQYTPVMLAYIPAPWILWVRWNRLPSFQVKGKRLAWPGAVLKAFAFVTMGGWRAQGWVPGNGEPLQLRAPNKNSKAWSSPLNRH
jgi:hypothetical protein